jgi:hypothetical protein
MKLYVELENVGGEVTQMVGGLDYKLKPGINWMPKAVAEFITTKVAEVKIVSSAIECDEAGVPLNRKLATTTLKEGTAPEKVEEIVNEDEVLNKMIDEITPELTIGETIEVMVDPSKSTKEEKESYRNELLEMTLPELKKILTTKDVTFRPQANKKELAKLIILNTK